MDVVGISILFPVSAYIVQEYSDKAIMVTLLGAVYAVAQFLATPVMGKFSDRVGRRPVLLFSLLGSVIGYLIFGLGGTLWVLFLSRLIDGITGGNQSTASAYIADVSSDADLAKNLGLVGLAWGVGLVLGPALGGFFGQFNLRTPAFIAAGLTFANLIMTFFVLPESLPRERRTAARMQGSDYFAVSAIREMGRLPGLAILLLVTALYNLGFNSMISTETLFVIRKFAAQPWQVGLMTMLSGILIAVVQFLLVAPLVKKLGERLLIVLCLVLQTASVVLNGFAPALIWVFVIVAFRTATGVSILPSLGALTARGVSAADRGTLMGVTTALNSLASVIGPILAGLAFDQISPAAPYWMAAVLYAVGMLLMATAGRKGTASLASTVDSLT